MISLLDVNVLIALGDSGHVNEKAAMAFFEKHAVLEGWATCPLTENAFLRIVSHPRYERPFPTIESARQVLISLRNAPGHQFWADDLSLANERYFPELSASGQLTDLYLLGLAVRHGGHFVTFDTRINPSVVPGGSMALRLLS